MGTKLKVINLTISSTELKNSVKSFALSKKYAKRLIRIGALNVLYRRLDIPFSEFVKKSYENIDYVVFKNKSNHKMIKQYHSYMDGCIDAIENNYLKEFCIFICDRLQKNVLEAFQFVIRYNEKESEATVQSNDVQQTTIEFLKNLNGISGTKWNVNDIKIYVECKYTENTPADYVAPNFRETNNSYSESLNKKTTVTLCKINTGFHKLSCYGTGDIFISVRVRHQLIENINTYTVKFLFKLKKILCNESIADEQADEQTVVSEINPFSILSNISTVSNGGTDYNKYL